MSASVIDAGVEAKLGTLLKTRSFGRTMRWYESVGSTNTIATQWAAADAPDGALVGAENQTAGRGRFDRTWSVEPGQNLTFSVILFPGLTADRLGMISIAFSLAVCDVLRDLVRPATVEIKWPNDILVDGKKVCGMLQESAFAVGKSSGRVVMGIGLNVNQTTFPSEISESATSLRLASGNELDRVRLLADLLDQLEYAYSSLHTGRTALVKSRYEARMLSIGRQVTFTRRAGGDASGIVTGIDDRGGLVVMTPAGVETVFAGDVTLGHV